MYLNITRLVNWIKVCLATTQNFVFLQLLHRNIAQLRSQPTFQSIIVNFIVFFERRR